MRSKASGRRTSSAAQSLFSLTSPDFFPFPSLGPFAALAFSMAQLIRCGDISALPFFRAALREQRHGAAAQPERLTHGHHRRFAGHRSRLGGGGGETRSARAGRGALRRTVGRTGPENPGGRRRHRDRSRRHHPPRGPRGDGGGGAAALRRRRCAGQQRRHRRHRPLRRGEPENGCGKSWR